MSLPVAVQLGDQLTVRTLLTLQGICMVPVYNRLLLSVLCTGVEGPSWHRSQVDVLGTVYSLWIFVALPRGAHGPKFCQVCNLRAREMPTCHKVFA